MTDYPSFPKIPRLFRDIVVTEKIDGTRGLISIQPVYDEWAVSVGTPYFDLGGLIHTVRAGSRNRWITPEDDNFGFAKWVKENAEKLAELGPGLHYGEWWGAGIQRRYGLTGNDKRFSLFNTGRWRDDGRETNIPDVPGLSVVPVLYSGMNHEGAIDDCLDDLNLEGSEAAPGFMKPEGVVVYHTAARTYSKVTIDNDSVPKGQAA